MSVSGYCIKLKKKVKMENFKVYKTERGSYMVRDESKKNCPSVVTAFVSEADAKKLAGSNKITTWKTDPKKKKVRADAQKKKKERKEKKKEMEKEKKRKEKEKAKKKK